MRPQDQMIARLRRVGEADGRLVAALLYGSFALGEADEWSDIDVILYFHNHRLAEIDPAAWVGQIAPLAAFYLNEFGNKVAIFKNLVRAEFHFDRATDMGQDIEGWPVDGRFPSLAGTVLVDKTGELSARLAPRIGPPPARDTADDVQFLVNGLMNWCLFGGNVLARGELARALEILTVVHDMVLRLARLVERVPPRWITPTKSLERELSAAAYRRFQKCTAPLERQALWQAYLAAWVWGQENLAVMAGRHSFSLPEGLMAQIGSRLEAQAAG